MTKYKSVCCQKEQGEDSIKILYYLKNISIFRTTTINDKHFNIKLKMCV